MTLPVIQLSGVPYSQGVQHGRALRDRIGHNLAVYFDRFWREANVPRDEVLERSRHIARRSERQIPRIMPACRVSRRAAATAWTRLGR
jgi:hypothetical protein